ncbi:MAG: hypothetical protein PWQ82_1297 [Thermosediminibacterales bacterium]|nr:hypothetical protein [Thermosediminibacterales bacterium]MDK2836517.1 hypothetical protein [Thermosediminibacterales bacterium]
MYDFDFCGLFTGFKGKKVQIFHGVIEKNWTYQHPDIKNYDALLVPGKFAYKRLLSQGISKDKIFEVGFPKLDKILRGEYDREKILREEGIEDAEKIVLYCPTHTNLSTEKEMFELFCSIEKQLPFKLIVKLHDGTKMAKDYNTRFHGSDNIKISNRLSNVELFAVADLLVSDVSSSIFEFALLNRPIIQLSFPKIRNALKNYGDSLEVVLRKKMGIELENPQHFVDTATWLLDNEDNFRYLRQTAVSEIFSFTDGYSGKRAADVILSLLKTPSY